jgi:hypothetical protein
MLCPSPFQETPVHVDSRYQLYAAEISCALAPVEREAVDAALAGTGCEALLDYAPRQHLGKRSFKLVFEEPRGNG